MAARVVVLGIGAYVAILALLAGLQVFIDTRCPQCGNQKEKLKSLLHLIDNKFADTTNSNICTLASADLDVSWLPSAHRTSPADISPGDSCSSSFKQSTFLERWNSSQYACKKLFAEADLTAVEEKWVAATNSLKKEDTVPWLLEKSTNCSWIQEQFSDNFFVSAEEKAFPIAYAINLNQYPHQIFRFLKVIYRPHNVYCLHYDLKSDYTTKIIMANVASCLGNVIIPRKIEDVYWGWYTIEEASFSCYSDLVLSRNNYPWKYVISLSGKEVPLRTNAEIVGLLRPLNGMSSVQTVGTVGMDDFKYKWKWSLNKMTGWVTKRDSPLPPIPYSLKVYKSWAYIALSYEFVEHLLCSPVGLALREYMKDVRIPEENTYAMLFMQPGTPGGFREEHRDSVFTVTSSIWLDGDHHGWGRWVYLKFFPHTICAGTNTHNVCMLGARDLHRVSYRPGIAGQQSDSYLKPGNSTRHTGPDKGPLFHNRYNIELDKVVMACMDGELARRNKLEHRDKCHRHKVTARASM